MRPAAVVPTLDRGGVAQMGERGSCKAEVVGSNPITSTKFGLSRETLGVLETRRGASLL